MGYVVHAEQMVPRPIAVVRRCAPAQALSTVVPAACGEVWNVIRARAVAGAGRHVAVYYDGCINLEVGVEVPPGFVGDGDGDVFASMTPAGLVATTEHVGPYDRLGDAHAAIRDWCRHQGHAVAGPNWEIYGHWIDDHAQPRTDVFYLLKG
jgi:effector-binding domain-containing protein